MALRPGRCIETGIACMFDLFWPQPGGGQDGHMNPVEPQVRMPCGRIADITWGEWTPLAAILITWSTVTRISMTLSWSRGATVEQRSVRDLFLYVMEL